MKYTIGEKSINVSSAGIRAHYGKGEKNQFIEAFLKAHDIDKEKLSKALSKAWDEAWDDPAEKDEKPKEKA